LDVDGERVKLPETMAYKGLMLSGVPNFAYTVGYTNASWTLKADLVSEYVCRLLAYMDRHGYRKCVAAPDESVDGEPFLDLMAGYVLRSLDKLPKQGDRAPWRLRQNYLLDLLTIRHGTVTTAMEFSRGHNASDGDSAADDVSRVPKVAQLQS
ncbi:MAG: FAD-containing monooxygenase EthA, partial [Sciscionella sp.]|nr:FAD-containing monooxygenase EthA [Sciscionella sp.]